MINLLFLYFTLFFTYTAHADSCQYEFIRHYNKKEYKSLRELNRKTFQVLKKQIKSAETHREKLNLIEQQYELISALFEAQKNYLTVLASVQKLSKEELTELVQAAYAEIVASHRLEINFIINESKEILQKTGFKTITKFRKINNQTQVKYLVFDMENSTSDSAKLLSRYMSRMGTNQVTFDFYQNMKNGSAGFSIATLGRIDLGIRGIRNLALDGILTMVGKHEFKHGGFAKMRAQGKDSIYHADYTSSNGLPLTAGNQDNYSQYMSAEELYNFVNNPQWASTRIADIKSYHFDDVINDILGINQYLNLTTIITKQTTELTDSFIKLLKSDLHDVTKVKIDFVKMDRTPAASLEEVHFVTVKDEAGGRIMHVFMNQEMKKEVQEILKIREKLYLDFHNELILTNKVKDQKAAQELIQKYLSQEAELASVYYQAISENIIKHQQTLNAVSTRITPLNDELIRDTDALIQVLKNNINDPNFAQKKEVIETFREYAKRYRELGLLVREQYKGFIAKDLL